MATQPKDMQPKHMHDDERHRHREDTDEQLELGSMDPRDDEEEKAYWTRLGFSSAEAFWAQASRVQPESMFAPTELPNTPVPGLAEISRERLERELAERRSYRQVGIKLRPADFDVLADAARAHGVAPTTLARILTVRGAKSLVEEAARRAG